MAEAQWPTVESQMRPWTRWWWLGSAVDEFNLSRLLKAYRAAGLGGVEITPIYGVQGRESQEIAFLSPHWMEMLRHTLAEAHRLGMGVDMATGTGWPFGGPHVSDADAEDKLMMEKRSASGGQPVVWQVGQPQALTAVSGSSETITLLDRIGQDGTLRWTPPPGDWTLYCVTQKWAGRSVKRAAPGGAGKCINPFSSSALLHHLEQFDGPLGELPSGALRCQFHDSFEYLADWSPALFAEFQARRGYDLRDFLPALYGDGGTGEAARVRTDYRETLSDLLRENFTRTWTDWAHGKGSLSRNQAHGSPGNLLDLYGTVDIPETEIFAGQGDPRISKFASSAAHVMGRPLTSSETCTWLDEHFTVSLGQCKAAIDRLLAAGINHIFYHGTAYSPADAAWPGWLFYASTTFTPDDPLWHDLPALNAYVTRCQSLLQSGEPDNDVLLFWPLHDLWQTRPGAYMLEINGTWLDDTPIGHTAQTLWERGFAFDYISDSQLQLTRTSNGVLHVPGGEYRAVVVPPCVFMPETTLAALLDLAQAGATIIFEGNLPSDVPGLGNLVQRRQRFQSLLTSLHFVDTASVREARLGTGRVLIGMDIPNLLDSVGVRRETVADHPDILLIRRRHADGYTYFLTNQSTEDVNGWMALASPFQSAALMDAMTGEKGIARARHMPDRPSEVYLSLPPGTSIFVRTWTEEMQGRPSWRYRQPAGEGIPLTGPWSVEFVEGGPTLPASFEMSMLGASWTERGEDACRFCGTARYRVIFNAPYSLHDGAWLLELGRVCDSARVSLNGIEIGTLIAEPFQMRIGPLQAGSNVLEIEVTNLAANRIRDMDRYGLPWKIFHEINFVDIHYRPFDASAWPVRDSGLLGPVRIVPLSREGSE